MSQPQAQGLPASEWTASMGNLLAEAGESASSEVRRLLTERYAAHERDGTVRMDARVHIVTGSRPV